jgi:branched-chain amino acid transport system substrate-binding protein
MLGANAAISTKLHDLAGPAAEGFLVGSGWFIGYDSPKNKAFVEAYRAKYNTNPDTFAAQAYAAVYVFADALKRAGGADDPVKLRDAIAATKDLDTSLGKISFDASREPVLSAKVLELKDGKFVLVSGD